MKTQLATGAFLLAILIAPTTALNLARKDHIKCIKTGERATARWTMRDGLICEFTDLVGINYKNPPFVKKPREKDDHNCMGMCGEGCDGTRIGGPYTQDCFNHDMCAYWTDVDEGKVSGLFNADCGDEFGHAMGDWSFGSAHCGRKNGKNKLHHTEDIVPEGSPLCHYKGEEPFYPEEWQRNGDQEDEGDEDGNEDNEDNA